MTRSSGAFSNKEQNPTRFNRERQPSEATKPRKGAGEETCTPGQKVAREENTVQPTAPENMLASRYHAPFLRCCMMPA
jgi:hypothetical protein